MLGTKLINDLIMEILSLLPGKSLVRFKCVSKSWKTLISDHEFIIQHLKSVETYDPDHNPRAFLIHDFGTVPMYLGSLPAGAGRNGNNNNFYSNYEPIIIEAQAANSLPDHLFYDKKKQLFDVRIVGFCHGMVCLGYPSGALIWNPTTREHRILPHDFYSDDMKDPLFGFGYDYTVYDYKVVRAPSESKWDGVFGVFTMRRNSIKTISLPEKRNLSVHHFTGSEFVNGRIYCIGIRKVSTPLSSYAFEYVLLCFVLAEDEEDVRDIDLPQGAIYDYEDSLPSLGKRGGCLCLTTFDERTSKFDLWLLNENYGTAAAAWTKFVSMNYVREECQGFYCRFFYFSAGPEEDDEIFMVEKSWTPSKIHKYNPGWNSFQEVAINYGGHPTINPNFVHVYCFSGTLASPNS